MIDIRNVKMISVQDWDGLIEETYGRTYSLQQQDGCKSRGVEHLTVPGDEFDFENDTVPEVINGDDMGVSFKAWLARDPKEWNGDPEDKDHLDLFWTRNFYPDTSVIANDLHKKGLLPAGDYVIEIDW